MGRRQTICLGLVGLICGSFPATTMAASATTVATREADAVAAGFRLHGSHGYSISAVAYSEGGSPKGVIEFTASRHGASVFYRAPASVTADSIRADLGSIGKVDVVRHPSGREKTVHPKCLGGAWTYEPSTYEGVIEFNGEENYTRATASRVAQLPDWLVYSGHGLCGSGYGESSGPGEPGARLRGISYAHGRSLSFQVNKNSSKARTVFTASLKERRGGIRIDRELTGVGPPSAFRFDSHLRTATLSPGSPFSGSASLSRSRNSFSPIWTGGLTLAFPGHSGVSLAGSEVHVSLVHARFTRSRDSDVEISAHRPQGRLARRAALP
ncbi:MAG TPA: hypothetical protein VKC63_03150 [Solirubrobacterales bacterium]|nr:hypothetical protein [Solirubrobacterales bacterium]